MRRRRIARVLIILVGVAIIAHAPFLHAAKAATVPAAQTALP
jgi:hypothetical protein